MKRRRSVGWLVPASLAALLGVGALAAVAVACDETQDVGSTAAEFSDAGTTTEAGRADATVDGAAVDASDAATDASTDGPANLVVNAGFDDMVSNANCGTGWSPMGGPGSFMTSSTARDGSASCEVCGVDPKNPFVLYEVGPMPDAGATLVPAAWFRGVEGTSLDGGTANVSVAVEGCFPYCQPTFPPADMPDASGWELQNGTQQFIGPDAGPTVFFEIRVADGCILVDDFSVYAQ